MTESPLFPSQEEMASFMDNPFQSLLYEQINNASGQKTLKRILLEAQKYDIGDLLSKVASLNMIIENQNKSIYFDSLIATLISQPLSFYTSTKKIKTKELRHLISQIEKTELAMAIDPPEVLFVERVRFYGNYWVFSGINYIPAYIIQRFIDVLVFNENRFNASFFQIAMHIINFVLVISNNIVEALNYGYHTQRKIDKKYVQIPDYIKMQELSSLLTFNIDYLINILKIECSDYLFSSFEETKLESILADDNQQFYQHPFIKTNNNNCILLNPTILIPFAVHQIILEAERFGQKDILLNLYNENNWKECRLSLDKLGHKKIKEDSLGISLFSSDSYRESLFSVGYNNVLWVSFYCDNGKNYSNNSMFSTYSIISDSIPSIEHINEVEEQLKKNGIICVGYISVYCSFGRVIRFQNVHAKKTVLQLNPCELHYIAVNERDVECYLPQYIKAKSIIKDTVFSTISELNAIEIYDSNHHSFYMDDNINLKDTMVYFTIGDSLDYIVRATTEEDRRLFDASDEIHLEDVILSDKLRKIYTPCSLGSQIKYAVPIKNGIIWILADIPKCIDEYNIIRSLMDVLSFWLAECRSIIDSVKLHEKVYSIRIVLCGEIILYKQLQNEINDLSSYLHYKSEGKSIFMEWTPQAYQYTHCQTNKHEKDIIISLLKELAQFGSMPINMQLVDEVFHNIYKKKFFSFNISEFPYYKPIYGKAPNFSFQFQDELIDTVGEYIKNKYMITGTIPDSDRTQVANDIVGYLYRLLQHEVEKVKVDGLYEVLCNDLEIVLYNVLVSRHRYIYDIACYPEKEKQYIIENSKLNEMSVSLKFLLEYVAACPPSGNQPIDEIQYSRVLTICSEIINWAYKNDLFFYHAVSSPISILGSGRIGIQRDEIDYLTTLNSSAMETRLRHESNPTIEKFYKSGMLSKYIDQLNEAFDDEYGFTFVEFFRCIDSIIILGENINEDVKKIDYESLVEQMACETEIPREKIRKIISMISLTEREDYMIPPDPYQKEDVYPWRFNREMSFTRRPIVMYDNTLIWGNRQLFHMFLYSIELIENGKYKARHRKLKEVIGKINNERGNAFNDSVINKLRSYKGFIVKGKVSKINKKRLEDENKMPLGDIDAMCIIPENNSIIAFEVKDFSFAKNPYEMEQEYKRMFVDGEKTCFVTKHKRRVDWLITHINDVIEEFNLNPGKWIVKEAYIVDEEIISNIYHKKGKTILLYSTLNEMMIRAI